MFPIVLKPPLVQIYHDMIFFSTSLQRHHQAKKLLKPQGEKNPSRTEEEQEKKKKDPVDHQLFVPSFFEVSLANRKPGFLEGQC
ncbi:hypothetical protein TNIN_405691 [Trichonephila inaurata madagascariensis]|uniref:Uncharacterized protein n=1 Tax=Trichonephila inaurata madagascariensis TaxID=2747483 RepID=A0A8X6IA11_9ARAC|nr:hypothetical protein TNIN_405691 [Trichonephila inaurata madagascariensis]